MTQNVNYIFLQFLNNGPIDKVVSNLQKKYTRYNGYIELLKMVEVKDIEDLTSFASEDNRQAMLLAEKLIGRKAFWASMLKGILYAIIHDANHGYSTGYSIEYLTGAEYVNLENAIRHEMLAL